MDKLSSFFKNTLDKDLPFVVYRKPGNEQTQAYRQKDKSLHYVTTFKEQGFVFAPFDTQKSPVLFPTESMEHFTFEAQKTQQSYVSNTTDLSEQKDTHIRLVKNAVAAIECGIMEKVVLSRSLSL